MSEAEISETDIAARVGTASLREGASMPEPSDHALLALERQFNAIAAEMIAYERERGLNARGSDGEPVLAELEAILDRLDPVGSAIMATPARSVVGLAVKARHAAYLVSHYWSEPIERMDLHRRAVRLLIEQVCRFAGVPLPFTDDRVSSSG
jgi:hypothetical protein